MTGHASRRRAALFDVLAAGGAAWFAAEQDAGPVFVPAGVLTGALTVTMIGAAKADAVRALARAHDPGITAAADASGWRRLAAIPTAALAALPTAPPTAVPTAHPAAIPAA